MHFSVTVSVAAATAAVSAVAAGAAWRHRDAPGGTYATVYLLAVTAWVAGVALETAATTLAGKLFWLNVQYVPVAVLPVASLAFVASYLGYDARLSARRLVALAVPLVALAVLSWTNPIHGLVRTSAEVVASGGDLVLAREPGPVWWVGWLYTQALIVASFAGLAYGAWDSAGGFRLQVSALFAGAAVPWLAQFPLLAGVSSVRPELLFSVTGFVFLAAVRWTRFLEVAPVGRRRVVEALSDPVFVFDGRDRLVESNPAATEWIGEASTGDTAAAVFDEIPAVAEAYRREEPIRDPAALDVDGERRYATVLVDPLPQIGNRPVGRLVVVRDVTRLKWRERELSAANERLETMANAIAHDLRNPLSVARGFHDLAREGDETAHDRIEDAHKRMATIIDETLASATDGSDGSALEESESVSVPSLARDAWSSVSAGEATLTVRGEGETEAVPGRLRGLFENLFRNAIEHASPGSEGDSDAAADAGVAITVAVTENGFVVVDDGPGIPPADRELVFERGQSGSDDGTGIGLAVVREIAVDHGWSLALSEGVDGGAAFVVATGYGSVSMVAAESRIVAPDADLTLVTDGEDRAGEQSIECN